MATGVKPRDDETRLTREDLENIQDAMKQKKFRDLLAGYCEEINDPANKQLYQKEMTQLEKERGYDVTFINPTGGYVIKTSVAGDRKAFINICSSETVAKPAYKVEVVDGKRGMNWQVPYSIIPPRDDFDRKRQRCVIYDVVFHPDTLRMAAVNKQFRELVNKTAFDALSKTYNIHLDNNNYRCPKSQYKGMSTPAVIRKEDPNYQPPTDNEEEGEQLSPEMLEKLYPQQIYAHPKAESEPEKPKESSKPRKVKRKSEEFTHAAENGYTIPKYVVKQQKSIDLQDYTYNRDCKQYSAIPSHISVEVYLPLLSSTKDCILDVEEKSLSLISEKPAKYKLNITLPYSVNDQCGTAKFDKSKHMLIVTLPVVKENLSNYSNSLRVDSGVESEENSGSQSDEEYHHSKLVTELSSTPAEPIASPEPCRVTSDNSEDFLDASLGYILPPYTHNVLDDIVAFTFHVKNTEPDSVKVKDDGNEIYIKFTSIGAGFVPVHYAVVIEFESDVKFDSVNGEAWDNNVILQLELSGNVPHKFNIGLTKESMKCEYFDVSQVKKCKSDEKVEVMSETVSPTVEVTNLGTETNIVVSSNHDDEEYDEDDFDSPTSEDRDMFTESESGMCENGAKSILRKPNYMRSYSESSMGDVASSVDYLSSDCIPEESSLKKTVRFNDVIARQFYRYNSSIEGQKKKNQRKKSKKRSQDRRKSESEAEDDVGQTSQNLKPSLKPTLKERRDSGLADTSDAETDYKSAPYEQSYNTANEDDHEDNDDIFSKNSTTRDTSCEEKSMLNIIDQKEDVREKPNVDNEDDHENNDDTFSKNSTTRDTSCEEKSMLNIIDQKEDVREKPNVDNEDDHENNDDTFSKNSTTRDTSCEEKSMLNIIDQKEDVREKPNVDIWESSESKKECEPITCDSIKHNTDLYDPDKLNKGQYLEVTFKNDLIFDLDM